MKKLCSPLQPRGGSEGISAISLAPCAVQGGVEQPVLGHTVSGTNWNLLPPSEHTKPVKACMALSSAGHGSEILSVIICFAFFTLISFPMVSLKLIRRIIFLRLHSVQFYQSFFSRELET